MYIKRNFELIYGKRGEAVYNVMPVGKSTLKAFELDKDDLFFVKNLVKVHIRSKNEIGSDIVLKNIDKIKVVRMEKYPLSGFVSKDGQGYINISVLPSSDISDFSTTDAYTLYLYSTCLTKFINSGSIPSDADELISSFLFSIFMKMYRKKAGLTGSYRDLIPKLGFIVWLYTYVGILGNADTPLVRKKIAGNLYTSFDDLELDYDFKSTEQFLKCLNDNNIVSISVNNFSNQVINYAGVSSLPMFEDPSRFFSVLISSNIPGSKLFSSYWSKVRPDLFKKVVNKGMMYLSRS